MNCQLIIKKRIHKYYTKIFVDSFNLFFAGLLTNSDIKPLTGDEKNQDQNQLTLGFCRKWVNKNPGLHFAVHHKQSLPFSID
jgi:hypothetical protein